MLIVVALLFAFHEPTRATSQGFRVDIAVLAGVASIAFCSATIMTMGYLFCLVRNEGSDPREPTCSTRAQEFFWFVIGYATADEL